MKIQKKYLALVSVAGALIALDQLTKLMVLAKLGLGESYMVLPNIFSFTYVRNYGAAFGFLAESHPEFRDWFFLLMPPAALLFILNILRTTEEKDRIQVFALSSIFGGAIGNYIDRLRFGFVVDFLDVHYKSVWTYPTFNVADCCIVVGIAVLMLLSFRSKNVEKTAEVN